MSTAEADASLEPVSRGRAEVYPIRPVGRREDHARLHHRRHRP